MQEVRSLIGYEFESVADISNLRKISNPWYVCLHVTAGGSGITAQLWKSVFQPKGLIHAAIDLLECCSSCLEDRGYDGGCPACIQAGECIKFNDFLSKSSALIIGKNLLERMEQTELYKLNEKENDTLESNGEKQHVTKEITSPRTRKRQRTMRAAKDIDPARQRQMVIGRPSWPMDRSDGPPQHQQEA